MEENITRKWRGDPLVRDFRTTRNEKVKKNRLSKPLAEALEQARRSLLTILVAVNKP
jgi:hypothetical protein